MIISLFGWLLDRAYGLITHTVQVRVRAVQRITQMGIHWVFVGTYMGTVDLTCIGITGSRCILHFGHVPMWALVLVLLEGKTVLVLMMDRVFIA